jgi:hypothetical protein
MYMISSGLARLGYVYINVDEGWLKGRNSAGVIMEDFEKFPSGMAALGSWVNGQACCPTCPVPCSCGLSATPCQLCVALSGNLSGEQRHHALWALLVSRHLPVWHGHIQCARLAWL